MKAQRDFIRATKVELSMGAVAALAGLVTLEAGSAGTPVGPVVALGAFVIAALTRIYVLSAKPERKWYEGRAAAESVKTLAWLYGVGGVPFEAGKGDEADKLFVQRVRAVLDGLQHLDARSDMTPQITDDMRSLRRASLADRKAAYGEDRLSDQQEWYSKKADENRSQARMWGLAVLGLQLAGALLATGRVAQWIGISLFGPVAALGSAAAAWLQTRQHEALTTAYNVTAQELAGVRSLLPTVNDEQSWAIFVEDSEEAISREHTMWQASRGTLQPRA